MKFFLVALVFALVFTLLVPILLANLIWEPLIWTCVPASFGTMSIIRYMRDRI